MAKVLGAIGIVLLIAIGFLWLLSGGRDDVRGLDASVLGTDGVVIALEKAGIKVTVAGPGTAAKVSDIDLRILPLYDMDLNDDRPETVGDTTLRTMPYWQLYNKIYATRTLVVLPKWRWAAAQKAIAAPETEIPLADYPKLFDQLDLTGLRLTRAAPAFALGEDGLGHQIALFQPQSFAVESLPEFCKTWGWQGPALILIRCDTEDLGEVYYLSDPDLMNNHGLTLGQNAAAFVAMVKILQNAPQSPVYLDRLAADYTTSDEGAGQDYERTADDLWRFFTPPLGEIWAMLSILLALFLWRGARRFGPIRRAADDTPERSRREAIATRARLIRLTGQDAAMVADYVRSDLTRMAETAFGRGKGEVGRLFPLLSRRNPTKAEAFQSLALDLMRAQPAPPASLRRQLDTYHQLQRTLTHGDDAIRVS